MCGACSALVKPDNVYCLKKRWYIWLLHMGGVQAPLCSDGLLTLAFIKAVAVAAEE